MKYALVTGASGGIGREISKALANDGFHLYLHYNNDEQAIRQLVNEIKEVNTWTIKADLSTKQGVETIVNSIHAPVECLVLNSGTSYVGLVTDMSDAEVEQMIYLQLTSPFLLTKALLPAMISNKKGNIIAVSSIWGQVGASCEVLYSTVKGGLNTFVKALAKEVAPSGIRVNGVAPGAIATKMLDRFSNEEITDLCDEIPMGRLGDAKEVAQLVQFLVSTKATYINGQIVGINGAWHC